VKSKSRSRLTAWRVVSHPSSNIAGLSKEGMEQVLAMVSSHADAGPFKLPVTRKQAPDYRIIVKRPMALSNVKSSLEKGQSIDHNFEIPHP
jgi:hypothetical protein